MCLPVQKPCEAVAKVIVSIVQMRKLRQGRLDNLPKVTHLVRATTRL